MICIGKTKCTSEKGLLPVAFRSRACKLENRLINCLRLSQGKIIDYCASWSLHSFSNHLTCTFLVQECDRSLIVPLLFLKNISLIVIKVFT